MEYGNSEFDEIGRQLVLPIFKGTVRAPNNSLNGLGRVQRSLVKEALSSDDFDGKIGKKMKIWTPGCNIILVGMGSRDALDHNKARDTGARVIASMEKKKKHKQYKTPQMKVLVGEVNFLYMPNQCKVLVVYH